VSRQKLTDEDLQSLVRLVGCLRSGATFEPADWPSTWRVDQLAYRMKLPGARSARFGAVASKSLLAAATDSRFNRLWSCCRGLMGIAVWPFHDGGPRVRTMLAPGVVD
jgi:hypothetical protein